MARRTINFENDLCLLKKSLRAIKKGQPDMNTLKLLLNWTSKMRQNSLPLFLFLGTSWLAAQPGSDMRKVVIPQYGGGTMTQPPIRTGAERTEQWFPLLKGKKLGLVVNPTSRIGNTHLVDSIRRSGHQITRIFAPEHGFRGEAANGQKVSSGVDEASGLPVVSLYGKHYRPSAEEMLGIDLMIFDIQDVGVRYYTYISTLHHIMEACRDAGITLLVLDRPNPNGYYVDGPMLDPAFKSFVGMHPIPLVHGMSVGELARMINGKGWLGGKDTCRLQVIPMQFYHHNRRYKLPVPPSPNLPNMESVRLYPSLGLFEGTVMSIGRGTDFPFQTIGAPWMKEGSLSYTPQDIAGKAINPPFKAQLCHGLDLREFARGYLETAGQLYLDWIILTYKECPDKAAYFNPFFDKLAGGTGLRTAIVAGKTAESIRAGWQPAIRQFLKERQQYMLYDWIPGAGLQD